jgi:hypothetical protein
MHLCNIVDVDGDAGKRITGHAQERVHDDAVGALGDVGGVGDGVVAADDEDGEDVDDGEGGLLLGDELFRGLEGEGFGGDIGGDAGGKGAFRVGGTGLFC